MILTKPTAWLGAARRGLAGRGTAWLGVARHGRAGHGLAGRGKARRGRARELGISKKGPSKLNQGDEEVKKVILAAVLTMAATAASGTEVGLIEELCIDLGADAKELYGLWSNGATRKELDAWIETTPGHPERRKVLVSGDLSKWEAFVRCIRGN